jgi:RND family efflux transporter MFP subunit
LGCEVAVLRHRPHNLLLVITLGAGLTGGCSPTGERRSQAAGARKPALVEVSKVHRGELSDRWSFMGNVRALMQAELAAGAEGEARRVRVREGDRVAKGQLLLQVDDRVVRARLMAARAQLREAREQQAQAERELKRFSKLTKQARSELELERTASRVRLAAARFAVLQAQIAQVRAELAQHRVVAPFAGVVTKRHVDPGDWVKRGQRALDLVSSQQLEVLVDVSPKLLRFVKVGDDARVSANDGTQVKATVRGVVGVLDPVARTAKIRLAPKKAALRSGAAVQVSFAIRHRGEGVVVPRDALLTGPVSTRVIKVVSGRATPVTVEVLATARARALVLPSKAASLRVGDRIVVRGNERLRPGQSVRVAKR